MGSNGFDVYLVNQLICQNHEEDFFQILSTSQKVRTLKNKTEYMYILFFSNFSFMNVRYKMIGMKIINEKLLILI